MSIPVHPSPLSPLVTMFVFRIESLECSLELRTGEFYAHKISNDFMKIKKSGPESKLALNFSSDIWFLGNKLLLPLLSRG